ncbi:MAG: GNAT family N-acetyltransferase [Thermaerobacter sp.]|nr:GNAT family N-acetyltransferase [Thermaerobacter sp.]
MASAALRPMREDEYHAWYQKAVADYAKDHAAAGNWSAAEALERSKKEFSGLLPQGLASPGQHLYSIVDPDREGSVGMLWFAERGAPETPHAFIYDIVVWEGQRGKGYGKGAMLALEPIVRALGLRRIGLHVFGTNETAIRLYERTGYHATNVLMSKDLDETARPS